MAQKKYTTLVLPLLLLTVGSKGAFAFDQDAGLCLSAACQEDRAVSSLLLAAGMYGGLDTSTNNNEGLYLSMNQSKDILKGLVSDKGQFDGQDITLSYYGSTGRLGFSAGYIYTVPEIGLEEPGSVVLGLHAGNPNFEEMTKPWYLTLDYSHAFQVNEDFSLGMGTKTMLLAPQIALTEQVGSQAVMSLNLPVSYKGFLTVTPEVQWSRSLANEGKDQAAVSSSDAALDSFYGGMSISFSY
jgi:hypothetical protein